jgi:starch synthase
MKIAFLSYEFPEYCVRIAGALARHAEVLLLLPHDLAAPYLADLPAGLKFQGFQKSRLRQPFEQVHTMVDLHRRIAEFNPDLVHIQHGHPWFNLGLPWLRRFPLVLTVHDPRQHLGDRASRIVPQAIMDFGYRQAHQLITHGKALKQVLVEECRIPNDRIHVIPHVRIGEDNNEPAHDDGSSILFFGRIWEYKGLEYLIRAEPMITSKVPEARIIIAGTGEDFARYRRLMANPGRFVVLNEYISDQKRAELFRQASIVVLPYIEASQSGVISLAYSAGKPVIATTVGALPEMVDDGQTGFLVPPRDEKALAEAVVRLLSDRELRREFAVNARQKVDRECSPEVVAGKTLRVYSQAQAVVTGAAVPAACQ